MEFGLLLQTYIPGAADSADPVLEHHALLDDMASVIAAERAGFKYAWIVEHHALTEYSHMSAGECFLAYALAQTSRIHVGSAIANICPAINHPVRIAERAAMLDHLSKGRYEFGTGRGAGSYELGTFNLKPAETSEIWEEVIPEFKKMWESTSYSFDGKSFRMPARNILPKPYGGGKTHPPMWVAAGNASTWRKAAVRGLGVLGFGFDLPENLIPYVEAYKREIKDATPVGQYINDHVMTLGVAICAEDGAEARRILARPMGNSYLNALVSHYHDNFYKPWDPQSQAMLKERPNFVPPPLTDEQIDMMIAAGVVCGDPDEVLQQLKRYRDAGVDQFCLSLPQGQTPGETTRTLELLGRYVIPRLDGDPMIRSDRMRYRV